MAAIECEPAGGIHLQERQEREAVGAFWCQSLWIGQTGEAPDGHRDSANTTRFTQTWSHGWSKGWMDYLAPQLYWPIAQKDQSFEVLLDYWHAQNPMGRHVIPAISPAASPTPVTERKTWLPQEISDQIALTRLRKAPQGHAFIFRPLL